MHVMVATRSNSSGNAQYIYLFLNKHRSCLIHETEKNPYVDGRVRLGALPVNIISKY